ncbi:hypothetical protein A6V39_05035 [Candidatus Mycoplasma haematobovis]|uniref:Uncharacterized protein n=1 Tax=Candidatus Mycoplasma haematobovis TaxID=432608 RepID=A0A1A9QB58_9MOLU|nr:hypothetical protein [Candidatus Mycoplasma haematobovis]OAL09792.1 hypothetical protein A6V39_05035 [Candidatus Mycoplasma haematobovis]
MAVPTTTHLTITGVGIASAGGLAYGGYFVFKDNPRPVTELLKSKNRVFLRNIKEDESAWNTSWQQYIQAHTKTVTNPAPAEPPTAPRTPAAPKAQSSTIIEEIDIWKLTDWKDQKSKKDKVPDSFKNKCLGWESEKLSGTWTTEYQNIEKYCTKVAPAEDS